VRWEKYLGSRYHGGPRSHRSEVSEIFSFTL
jgi:hypothetical protein